LSSKHTLAIVNRGSATSSEIVVLARAIRDGVQAKFGVRLEPEPVLVGLEL
jgi:UDP-N-acetylmuramate dehydrogenase